MVEVTLRVSDVDDAGAATAWHVIDRLSGEQVGTIGFQGRDASGAVLVGYETANEHRNCGYATEALRAVLAQTADPVVAETQLDHVASRRVMEKAGMQIRNLEGTRVVYASSSVPSSP